MKRRIVTARQQVDLLSPWRTAAMQFPWRENGNQEESRQTHSPDYPDKFLFDRWTASLENGHWLEVRGLPNHDIGSGYAAVIHTGGSPDDEYLLRPADELLGEKNAPYDQFHVGVPYHNINSLKAMYYDNPPEKLDNGDGTGGLRPQYQLIHSHPDRESAMTAAEKAYQYMYPLGTNTGTHDSGVDYDKIIRELDNPHGDDNDDFGDIFGKESMRRRAGFDWWPDHDYTDDMDTVDAHVTRLENGHEMRVGRWPDRDDGSNRWWWQIYTHAPDYNLGGHFGGGHLTREEAQQAAERQYHKQYPLGTNTGGHDSGVDYDKLINPSRNLDDNFGDIFGKESMRRTAVLFDWKQKYHEPDLAWHTKTETGHVLTVNSPRALSGASRTLDAEKRGQDIGWAWNIHDLNDPDPLIQDYSWRNHSSFSAHLKGGLIHAPEHGTDPRVYSGEYLPTFDAAVAQAEKAFLERFSGGRSHPRADIPDYDRLVNPHQDLDDDFGDIFGKESRRLAVHFVDEPDRPTSGWVQSPNYMNAETRTDLTPNMKAQVVYDWHPPHGETHIKYTVGPVQKTDGSGDHSGLWYASTEGPYQGRRTLGPDNNGDTMETNDYDWRNSHSIGERNHPSAEAAMAAAEEYHRQKYGEPQQKPGADYYENILNNLPDLDEKFDIFGDDHE